MEPVSSTSSRLVAAIIAAGAASLTLSTGVASAAPNSPVTAEKCGKSVTGERGQPVNLASEAVGDRVQAAMEVAAEKVQKKNDGVLNTGLLGKKLVDVQAVTDLVKQLLAEKKQITLPDESVPGVGKINNRPIPQVGIQGAIVEELDGSFTGDAKPLEEPFAEELGKELGQNPCTITTKVIPPDNGDGGNGDGGSGEGGSGGGSGGAGGGTGGGGGTGATDPGLPPPSVTGPPPSITTPPVLAPPQLTSPGLTSPGRTSPPSSSNLPPVLSPRAPGGQGGSPDSPPRFDSPPFGTGAPAAPQPQPAAPVGNATALAKDPGAGERDGIGFGMLAGVLAASAVTAGLVRASARRSAG